MAIRNFIGMPVEAVLSVFYHGCGWRVRDWLLFACIFAGVLILSLLRREDPWREREFGAK